MPKVQFGFERKMKIGIANRGERQGRSKLTEAQILEIRSDKASSHAELSRKYGVTRQMIELIRHKKRWAWLKQE
jgi:hypothetical protein